LENFEGKRVFFKAMLNKVYYFAYATLKFGKKENKFYFSGNGEFYRCQLRKDLRVTTGPKFKVKCMIGTSRYKVVDLSISGIKFFVSEKKKDRFLKGQTINNLDILLGGNVFTIKDCSVIRQESGTNPVSGVACRVVATKFDNIPRKTEAAFFRELNSIVFMRNK